MLSLKDIWGRGTWHEPARGYSLFTRPGYSKDGYAVVHGEYVCGPLCAHANLFVLRRTPSGWEVIAIALLWLS
jgi:hypothetical protein